MILIEFFTCRKKILHISIALGLALSIFVTVILPNQQVSAQTSTAELGVFEVIEATPGSVLQVPVVVKGVNQLYGVDFILEYDPGILQVVDVNPTADGIQADLGDFLDPGLLLFNAADNKKGTYRFAMSQVNPSEPKSGEGNVVIINFKVVGDGETSLNISYVKMGDREGNEIPVIGVNSALIVRVGAPTQSITYQVIDATSVIPVRTFTPTPTSTPVPLLTPVSGKTITSGVETANVLDLDDPLIDDESRSYWLVNNWWILLVLMAVVVALAAYLIKKDRKKNRKEGMNNEK